MFFFHSEFQLKFLSPCFLQKPRFPWKLLFQPFKYSWNSTLSLSFMNKILKHQGQRSQILKKKPTSQAFYVASEPSVGQHQQKGAVEQKSHEKRHLPSQCLSGWKLQQIAKLKSLNEIWVVLGGGTCDKQYTAIHRIIYKIIKMDLPSPIWVALKSA